MARSSAPRSTPRRSEPAAAGRPSARGEPRRRRQHHGLVCRARVGGGFARKKPDGESTETNGGGLAPGAKEFCGLVLHQAAPSASTSPWLPPARPPTRTAAAAFLDVAALGTPNRVPIPIPCDGFPARRRHVSDKTPFTNCFKAVCLARRRRRERLPETMTIEKMTALGTRLVSSGTTTKCDPGPVLRPGPGHGLSAPERARRCAGSSSSSHFSSARTSR